MRQKIIYVFIIIIAAELLTLVAQNSIPLKPSLSEESYDYSNTSLLAGVSAINEDTIKNFNLEAYYKEFGYPNMIPESDIYSFLQGPKAWENGLDWSGSWCEETYKGNSFGGFGCGLCCMANIYSTISDYECSPLDMFEFAKEISGYSPSRKIGAIGWGDMKVSLRACGFDCDLYYKPDTYDAFRDQMENGISAIVLVSSYEDDTFWQKTSGHYVNIWSFNPDTEEVFLAEPGSLTNNRSWIPLRYVYNALKTSSDYQYIMVDGYDDNANTWKHDGINIEWNSPM